MVTDSLKTRHVNRGRIALFGGIPVRSRYLSYGHHWIEESDIEAVVEVLRSDWITTGPKIAEFEEAVAAFVGARYAIAFNSGTAALHAAAFAAGVGPGDEAITTPLTFCATANCVLYQGATPIFADISPDTLNINPEEVARRISPQVKVILPVDYAGHPAELAAIRDLAKQHELVVIEDAAHAFGAEYRGRRVGSISHMTVFSFHPVKHITTGEGGMVTTDDPKLVRKLQMFRNHGIDSSPQLRESKGQWHYEMVALGYNYRLTDVGCALGLSQLQRLEANLTRRRGIARRYEEAFRDLPGVVTPVALPDANPAWHLYPIRLALEELVADRREVFDALRAENIGVQVHYIPVHLHPYYRERLGCRAGQYPVAEDAYERLISLPIFPTMSDHDVEDVIEAVGKVLRYYAR